MTIPNGVFKVDGGTFVRSNWKDADILVASGVPVAAHEAYSAIGTLNIADFIDPTPRGDVELGNRKLAANIDVMTGYFDVMRSSGIYDFGIDSTGLSGTSNPITTPTINPNYSGLNNTGYNPFGQGNVGLSTAGGANTGGGLQAPDSENYAGQFNARLGLIEEYCDKYGKTVDVNKIRSEYANKPKEGLAYCDDILNNKFDQAKLEKLVHKKYDAYNKSRLDAGKAISDQWVDAVIKSDHTNCNLSASGVTKNNILDVNGTFMTNPEVKNGKASFEQVFENPEAAKQLIDTLKAKADEVLLMDEASDYSGLLDDEYKERITTYIAELRDNYDKYLDSIEDENKHNDLGFNSVRKNLVESYVNLSNCLRVREARANDEVAPQYYGLPENSSIEFTDQTDRANDEITSYKNRRKLSRTI